MCDSKLTENRTHPNENTQKWIQKWLKRNCRTRNRISVPSVINRSRIGIFWRRWICSGTKIAWSVAAVTVASATSAPHCSRARISYCAKVITWGEREVDGGPWPKVTSDLNKFLYFDFSFFFFSTFSSIRRTGCTAIRASVQRAINWFRHSRWWCEPNEMSTIWSVLRVSNAITGESKFLWENVSISIWHKIDCNFSFSTDFASAIDSICVITKFSARLTTRSVRCAASTLLRRRVRCTTTTPTITTTKVLITILSAPETRRNHRRRHSNDSAAMAHQATIRPQTMQRSIRCRRFSQMISWTTVTCDALLTCPSASGRLRRPGGRVSRAFVTLLHSRNRNHSIFSSFNRCNFIVFVFNCNLIKHFSWFINIISLAQRTKNLTEKK